MAKSRSLIGVFTNPSENKDGADGGFSKEGSCDCAKRTFDVMTKTIEYIVFIVDQYTELPINGIRSLGLTLRGYFIPYPRRSGI